MKQIFLALLLTVFTVSIYSETVKIQLDHGILLILEKEPFEKNKHNIKYRDSSKQIVDLIDEWLVFGTDAHMPASKLVSAILMVEDQHILLETSGMYNPWDSALYLKNNAEFIFKVSVLSKTYMKIWGTFSTGAGSYEVEWHIVDGRAYRASIRGVI